MKIRDRLKIAKDNAGLTLVEVIVSITILACISVPLMAYFSQSLQYSVVTAKQQKATTLAQNLTEGLKSQQSLLRQVSGNDTLYTVPYLDNTGMYTISAVSGGGLIGGVPCFQVDGTGLPKGTLKYTSTLYETGSAVSGSTVSSNTRKYDVDITLSTESALNDGNHPILYGIDDTTDVISIEREQITTALMNFKSINDVYGAGYLSESDIQDRMKRTIVVDFDYNNDDPANPLYQIQVYYIFTCTELRGSGDMTVDTITPPALNYTMIYNPKNFYLMYNRLHPTVPNDSERIIITVSDNVKNILGSAGFKLPEFYLIVQNLSDDTSLYDPTGYNIALGMDPTFSGEDLSDIKIHTNVVEVNESGNRDFKYGKFKDITTLISTFSVDAAVDPSVDVNVASSPEIGSTKITEVTDQGPQLRTVNIKTEVYDVKSDGTRGELLATYTSSKGE